MLLPLMLELKPTATGLFELPPHPGRTRVTRRTTVPERNILIVERFTTPPPTLGARTCPVLPWRNHALAMVVTSSYSGTWVSDDLNHGWREHTNRQPFSRSISGLPLYTLGGRVPDQLVDLQAEPRWDIVGENPFGEFCRVKKTMRGIARSGSSLFERRGKQDRVYALGKAVTKNKVAGEFVIRAVTQDELEFIMRLKHLQIL